MKKTVILLGFFDSVHIGHRYLIDFAQKIAKERNADLSLATFDDDFLSYFGKKGNEIFLLEERKEILFEIGVDKVIVFPTDKTFLSKSKYEFMELLKQYNPCALVCGTDYRFGKNAEGCFGDLQDFFMSCDVEVFAVNLCNVDNQKVSSGAIRNYLKNGLISEANSLLGRNFFYEGIVVKGRGVGRQIGFPTANIYIPKAKIHIRSGVYASYVTFEGERYLSVSNVGIHPTFDDGMFNVESYILEKKCILYGKKIRVEILAFIRDIIRFSSKEELAEQIAKDIEYTKLMQR